MKKFWIKVLLSLGACTLSLAAQALPTNKQLTIGVSQEFEALNPTISQMGISTMIYSMVGRPLVSISPDWKWECYLCVTIPSVENGLVKFGQAKDGTKTLSATWEIDANAVWGDGTPLTGHDVRFSWEVGMNPNVAVGMKDTYERITDVEIDEKNPKKFTLHFKEVRYDHYQLGTFYILPKHIDGPVFAKTKDQMGAYEKQTKYSTDPLNPGLYSGPYKVAEIKLGSHVILDKNPKWYGKAPAIEKIIVKYIPSAQTQEANLLSGTIDVMEETGLMLDQILAFESRLEKSPELKQKFRIESREGMTYEHIDFNLRNEVLKDLKVRQALAHAIDLNKLTKALFNGRQKPALHNIHPLDVYFTDDVAKYPYDVNQAEKLLDEAGWKKTSGPYRVKNGQTLKMTIMTTSQNKTRELVEVWLQNEWKKIGLELDIKNEPARVFFGETVKKGFYPHMAMFAWISSPDNLPNSTIGTENIPTAENGFNGQNSGAYSNPEVDKLLDLSESEFDVEKRKEYMKRVLQLYKNDLPALPLYYRSVASIVPANLEGFRLTGHQFPSTLKVEYWNLRPEASH